tara:strand:+ start:1455 stop:2102 length:648 start_codon:yes stop_codon:yes gene_type:complete
MKVFIDLFCGLGGASQAFDEHPGWKTIKIDNNPDLIPHVHGMILADIHNTDNILGIVMGLLFPHKHEIEEVVIWASPPCTEFSLANPNRPEEPDMTLLECVQTFIQNMTEIFDFESVPVIWGVENVKGAVVYFDDQLERPWHQRIGPIYLWGTLPCIDFVDAHHREHKKTDKGAWTRGVRALRPNLRAMVPYAVSRGLLDSLEHQTSLTDFESLP